MGPGSSGSLHTLNPGNFNFIKFTYIIELSKIDLGLSPANKIISQTPALPGEISGSTHERVLHSNRLSEENPVKVLNVLVLRWTVGIHDIATDKEMISFSAIRLGNIISLCCRTKSTPEFDTTKSTCP